VRIEKGAAKSVKTDDRATRQPDEVEGEESKVVRLSDWLAPDDELVPFGPRAHARTATRVPIEGRVDPESDAEPPAASGFWDGDPSVHTAVPGPGIFDEAGGPTPDRRYRRPAPAWRPALPSLHPFGWELRVRERLGDLADRLPWRWVATAVASIALALIVLVITLGGGSSGHHETAVQAGIGEPSHPVLSGTLDEIGGATRAVVVSDLRQLPHVDTGVRTLGTPAQDARALQVRYRRHVVAASASVPNPSTTGAAETATTTPAPAETVPAPSETEPTQTTSSPAPTTGGGGSPSGGSGSGSQKQSTFGATGSLGPGSSPNG
jgi:hypothetical protein